MRELADPMGAEQRRVSPESVLLCVVIIVMLAFRLNAGLSRDLWQDEVIATANADNPFWRLPVAVIRYDIHPFLYFLQLRVWSLFGDGDLFLRINSLMWNIISIFSMFFVVGNLHGRRAGYLAAALFSVSAPVVWMAQELRQYSWMYCLIIWNYYFVEKYFYRSAMLLREGLIVGALNLAVIHSHAMGFLAIFLLGLQALVRILETGATRRRLLGWLTIYGVSALAAVPPIAIGLLKDGNLPPGDGVLSNLLDWITRLLMPRGDSPILLALAAGLYVAVVLGGVLNRQLRLTTLLFLVLPLVVATAMGVIGLPVFKLNIFSTIMAPFLALVMACLIARLPDKPRLPTAVALGLVLALFSTQFLLHRPQTTGFRAVTEIIAREGQPGDLVYVPQASMFWGVARYFGTEETAWHLRVAPEVPPKWRPIYDFLGPKLISWFELEPETRWLATRAGYDMVVGDLAPVVAAQRPRVWLVSYPSGAFPYGLPPATIGPLTQTSLRNVNNLELRLYQ